MANKFSQAGKMMWWKMKGMSQQEMAERLMEDPEAQETVQKIQLAVKMGKVRQSEILEIQELSQKSPRKAQKKMNELLKRIDA